MKRMLMIALLPLLSISALAAECRPVEQFRVGRVHYKLRPAEAALHRLLRGTPYRAVFEAAGKPALKARRLSGPLSRTLDLFARQTGTSWQQHSCQIRFTDRQALTPTAVPAAPRVTAVAAESPAAQSATWTLRADTPIHLQFAEWARRAGWQFEWKLEKSWLVPAAAQFSGSFDEALAQAVEGLYAQGKPVRLILWEGNRFAEIVDVDAK